MKNITYVRQATPESYIKRVISLSFCAIKSKRKIYYTLWDCGRRDALSTTKKTFLLCVNFTLRSGNVKDFFAYRYFSFRHSHLSDIYLIFFFFLISILEKARLVWDNNSRNFRWREQACLNRQKQARLINNLLRRTCSY